MTKQLPDKPAASTRQMDAIRTTIIVAFMVAIVIGVFILYFALMLQLWQVWALFIDVMALAIVGLICLAMFRRSHTMAAIWLLISAADLAFFCGSLLFNNAGVLTGIGASLLISLLALQVLSNNRERLIALIISLISGMACVIVGLIGPSSRPGIPDQISLILGIAIAVTGVTFMVIASRRFNDYNLRTKTIFVFLISTAFISVGGSVTSVQIVQSFLQRDASDKLRSAAQHTSDLVDTFIQTQLDAINTESQFPVFTGYLQDQNNPDRRNELDQTLHALIQENPQYYISIGLLDNSGKVIADTNISNIGTFEGNRDYIVTPIKSGLPFMSVWYFTDSLYFAAPVRDAAGTIIGVLRTQYHVSILQQLILNNVGLAGQTSFPILIDENYIILSHASDPTLLLKPAIQLPPDKLNAVIAAGRLSSQGAGNLTAVMPALDTILKNPQSTNIFEIQNTDGTSLNVTIHPLKSAPWFIIYGQPQEAYLSSVNTWGHISTLLAMAIILIAIFMAAGVAEILINPISRLTAIARQITSGDLQARVNIHRADEIGELATSFNQMTDALKNSLDTLEERIEKRTSDLDAARAQSEKRAAEMQTVIEIARYISTERDLEQLLTLVTHTVSERFGFYHVGIFLLDDTRKYAVLRAANSPGGQAMLRRQHRLEVGHLGIVGNVTSTGMPRIALDTGADLTYFNNPDLPDTHSEMALPLTVRDTIIGALDVQSTVQNAFTEADVSLLSLLADQIAIVIDNTRLLEETQKLLSEARSMYKEYLADAWQKKRTAKVLGYQQSLDGGKVLTDKVLKEAATTEMSDKPAIDVPIRVRDQVVGIINISSLETGRKWRPDEINIVNAIAERLGLALDNARLFEEATMRASRERLVADITTQIRGSNNPQEMIKIAVQELQRALGATRVEIIPQKPAPPPDR